MRTFMQTRSWGLVGTSLLAAMMLQGCVAAIPAGAAVVIGEKVVKREPGSRDPALARARGKAEAEAPPAAPPAPPPPPKPSQAQQFLYGSGEAAALSAQAYNGLIARIRASADYRALNFPVASVVLGPESTLIEPSFVPCDEKPLAIILDIDETTVLNLGYQRELARRGLEDTADRRLRWEATGGDAVEAAPGALPAVKAAEAAKMTVIYISNRDRLNAEATARMLDQLGFGRPVIDQTLLLRRDDAGPGKDTRRQRVAAHFCVIAMVGDQLGDFSDLFDSPGLTPAMRRTAANNDQFGPLWGAGWYLLPNPVYGTGPKGDLDDLFPTDKQWADPAGGNE